MAAPKQGHRARVPPIGRRFRDDVGPQRQRPEPERQGRGQDEGARHQEPGKRRQLLPVRGQEPLRQGVYISHQPFPTIRRDDARTCLATQIARQGRFGEHPQHLPRQLGVVVHVSQQASVADQLGDVAGARDHHGPRGGHGFDERDRRAFVASQVAQDIAEPDRLLGGAGTIMRVLITGGAGFIGSHLAEKLLEDGHHVFVLDDLSTGSADNIASVKSHPRFDYLIETMTKEPALAEQIDWSDVVFHLAAAVGVRLIVEAPVRTIETNVYGTELVLRHAAKKRRLVIITSTSEVYGKGARLPFREDFDLVMGSTKQSRWTYACSKAIDEFLALAYWKEKHLPVVIARLFNTVGPRQTGRYGMVIQPLFSRRSMPNQSPSSATGPKLGASPTSATWSEPWRGC